MSFKKRDIVICTSSGFIGTIVKDLPKYPRKGEVLIIQEIQYLEAKPYILLSEYPDVLWDIRGFKVLVDRESLKKYRDTVSTPEIDGFEQDRVYPLKPEHLE